MQFECICDIVTISFYNTAVISVSLVRVVEYICFSLYFYVILATGPKFIIFVISSIPGIVMSVHHQDVFWGYDTACVKPVSLATMALFIGSYGMAGGNDGLQRASNG